MRPPRDPTRRNRNLGTSKQGHGADNEHVVPDSWHGGRVFYERLRSPRELRFEACGCERVVLVEPPREGCLYGCTVDDIVRVVSALPASDIDGLDLFVMRQPTRRQSLLRSVWGRFVYEADVTPPDAKPGAEYTGPAIVLEAQELRGLRWSKSMSVEERREFERLRADGHELRESRRGYELIPSEASLRRTLLQRTLLHEVGHYVDWLRSVLCIDDHDECLAASDAFSRKPSTMKEDFAHRYAAESAERLTERGVLPFPVRWDAAAMRAAGVERAWFVSDAGTE